MNQEDLNYVARRLPLSKSTLARNPLLASRVVPVTPADLEFIKSSPVGILPCNVRVTTDEDRLNKTERRYLNWLRGLGDSWVGVQCITLKVGDDCRFTPDFAAIDSKGLRLIDVKACNRKTGKPLVQDDARVKLQVAARLFPWIRFVVAYERDRVWVHDEVKP